MNEIKFTEGGQPISLDDLKQLSDNITSSVALLASLCGDGILDGCYISGDQTSGGARIFISPGHAIIGGAIYDVDETEMLFNGLGLGNLPSEIYLVPSADESRSMDFADGSTHPTRVRKTAIAVRERPSDRAYIAYKLSANNSSNPRPFIPRSEEAKVDSYRILRDGKQVGNMNLHVINGLHRFRACELHIPIDNNVIRSTDAVNTMYTIDGPNSNKLYFSLRNVVDIWQRTTYDIIIAGGNISLQKEGQRINEFDGHGLNAFALIKTDYSLV
ncbi:hypothetical protein [Porphyromonas bobii]|uniref:hypothetical protein n=1 Tax=Porphyromonas bobii TaxID=2811780 RepID=UPI001C006E2C|nr:hypothetical protein [Porphyromonas bobii]